jgi:hypothetical protein
MKEVIVYGHVLDKNLLRFRQIRPQLAVTAPARSVTDCNGKFHGKNLVWTEKLSFSNLCRNEIEKWASKMPL